MKLLTVHNWSDHTHVPVILLKIWNVRRLKLFHCAILWGICKMCQLHLYSAHPYVYIIYIWSFSWDYLHIQCWQCLWLWMKMNWREWIWWVGLATDVEHSFQCSCWTYFCTQMLNILSYECEMLNIILNLRPWTFFWTLVMLRFCASTFNTFCSVCT